jgi:hypothetical protein
VTLFPRRRSIRTRLALIYTALLAAALIAFGTGVFVVLREELERSFDAGLIANAEHAGGAFAQDIDSDGVLRASERLIEQLASTGGASSSSIRVVPSSPIRRGPEQGSSRSAPKTWPRRIATSTRSASLLSAVTSFA